MSCEGGELQLSIVSPPSPVTPGQTIQFLCKALPRDPRPRNSLQDHDDDDDDEDDNDNDIDDDDNNGDYDDDDDDDDDCDPADCLPQGPGDPPVGEGQLQPPRRAVRRRR